MDEYQYYINEYRYKDISSGVKFVIYSRTIEYADYLANKLSEGTDYKLRKCRIRFIKKSITRMPPYELEQAQLDGVIDMIDKYSKYIKDKDKS